MANAYDRVYTWFDDLKSKTLCCGVCVYAKPCTALIGFRTLLLKGLRYDERQIYRRVPGAGDSYVCFYNR